MSIKSNRISYTHIRMHGKYLKGDRKICMKIISISFVRQIRIGPSQDYARVRVTRKHFNSPYGGLTADLALWRTRPRARPFMNISAIPWRHFFIIVCASPSRKAQRSLLNGAARCSHLLRSFDRICSLFLESALCLPAKIAVDKSWSNSSRKNSRGIESFLSIAATRNNLDMSEFKYISNYLL